MRKFLYKIGGFAFALSALFAFSCSSGGDGESDGGNGGSESTLNEDGTTTLKIQETDNGFVSHTGSLKTGDTRFTGYSGNSYLEGLGANCSVIYSVNSPESQDVSVLIRYAYWGTKTDLRGAYIVVNEEIDSDIIYCNWTSKNGTNDNQKSDGTYHSIWEDSNAITVSLPKGESQIRVIPVPKDTDMPDAQYPSGVDTTNAACTFKASGNLPNYDYIQITGKDIAAGKNEVAYYTVSVASDNDDYGTVEISPKKDFYKAGTEITVTATPNVGYKFDSWSGTATSSYTTYSFTATKDFSLTARFVDSAATIPEGLFGYATVCDDNGTSYIITGGEGGEEITIASYDELNANSSKISGDVPYIITVSGLISTKGLSCPNVSRGFNIGSNKTLKSGATQGQFQNIGFKVQGKNVIIKNLKFGEVIADSYYANQTDAKNAKIKRGAADAMELNGAEHVWIDHCEFQSHLTPMAFNSSGVLEELTFDASKTAITVEHSGESPEIAWRKDYYDGLLDIKNQSRFITVSNCYFHDHYKACLCGSNDTDDSENVMRVTFYYNYWKNINARAPLFRFGKAHVFSSYFVSETACKWMYMSDDKNGNSYSISDNVQSTAINCRASSELYIDNNCFENIKTAVGHYNGDSDTPGTWTTKDNEGFANSTGNSYFPPYSWDSAKKTASDAKTYVVSNAGPKLN